MDESPDLETVTEQASVRERRCGRCQLMFPGDPASHATAQLGWWLCDPCRQALVGHQAAGRW